MNDELQKLVLEYVRLTRERNRAKKEFDKISSQINNVNYNINTLLDEEEAAEIERKRRDWDQFDRNTRCLDSQVD